jgi:hypothetical protein
MKLGNFFIIPLLFHCFFSLCQENYKIDTIKLSNLHSNIPIISSITYLMIITENVPCSMDFNKEIYTYNRIGKHDTTFIFNSIYCYSKGLAYYEKEGRIRLLHADFKLNPYIVISTNKIVLSKDLTMEDVKKAYNYTEDDFAVPQLGIMQPYEPKKRSDRFYAIRFSTGEHDGTYMILYFDKKKKLRYLYINAYAF